MSEVNSSTLSVTGEIGSFATVAGPIVQNQLAAAISVFRTIGHQYLQLLDVVSNIAGPNLVPTGTPPVHTAGSYALQTWNFTASSEVSGSLTGWSAANDPVDSPWRSVSARAAGAPSIFLDRIIYGPFTGRSFDTVPSRIMQNGQQSGDQSLVAAALRAATPDAFGVNLNPYVTAVGGVKIQIFSGAEGQKSAIMTVNDFVANVARPLMEAYQVVLEKLHGRLKASEASSAAQESALWAALNTVTPDATQKMYEKLEILRTGDGRPVYSPPTAVHAARDTLVAGVVECLQRFPVVNSLAK